MTKRKSLLTIFLMQFLGCCVAIFILMAPVFYLLTKYYYAEDIMDIIQSVKQGDGIPPLDLERDIMKGMMIQFFLIFTSLSFAFLITVRFIAKRLWMPFNETLRQAENFNLAQGDIPSFKDTKIKEFSVLNKSLELLMRKDKDMYQIQKEFTENASHELQTPLAIVCTKLDLIMQENLNENQTRIVSDLYYLCIRMGHLNRNLLILAKIENSQYATKDSIDILSMLEKTIPHYRLLNEHVSIHVDDKGSKKQICIVANRVLLECLVKNLIVNAIRHSTKNNDVNVVVEKNKLSVINVSDNNAPLDPNLIFRRFAVGSTTRGGNGLGLSIVKAICDFHGWRIEYLFKEGKHTFEVSFS